jgi:hypothetical protein
MEFKEFKRMQPTMAPVLLSRSIQLTRAFVRFSEGFRGRSVYSDMSGADKYGKQVGLYSML